jgi:hypothetical protein
MGNIMRDTAVSNDKALKMKYSSALISMGNAFKYLLQLCETADNTEHCTQRDICVTHINTVKFD